MHINYISYDQSKDSFVANLTNNGVFAGQLTIDYSGVDSCMVSFNSPRNTFDSLPYSNASCLIADVLRAIADAQEREAAELPSDLTLPLNVPNTFTMPAN